MISIVPTVLEVFKFTSLIIHGIVFKEVWGP